jgi:hypothetical protein
MRFLVLLFSIICLLQCNKARSKYNSLSVGIPLGNVDSRLAEASGLVASITNPGFLWTINDSGNPAEVFLIDRQGRIRMVCTLPRIRNRDWEDIAIDRSLNGEIYLYIADIGDNNERFDYKMIYRFEEPRFTNQFDLLITKFDTIVLKLPDGSFDAETILIDPRSHEFFVLSKMEKEATVYSAGVMSKVDTIELVKMATLPFRRIVAGSISTNGNKVLLKNYLNIYYWERSGEESLPQALATLPTSLPYQPEPQGEAMAWSLDATEFFTLSERSWSRPASLLVYSISADSTKKTIKN